MYYIVGLGNPGDEYKITRHNIGRMAIDYIAEELNISSDFKTDKIMDSDKVKAEIENQSVLLIKPNSFMNKSGKAISPIVQGLDKEAVMKKAKKIIVIQDDIDMPIGKIRILFNRGTGGHRGVESIKKVLKTDEFIRIKIGVLPVTPAGKPKKPKGEDKVVSFILGQFQKTELKIVNKSLEEVLGAVRLIVSGEIVRAMNQYN